MRIARVEEISLQEINRMGEFRTKHAWNDAEKAEIVNLVRRYIDPHQESCMSCAGGENLIEARRKVGTYYLAHIDKVRARYESPQTTQTTETTKTEEIPAESSDNIDETNKQVDDYMNKKFCKCGKEIKDKRRKNCEECRTKK